MMKYDILHSGNPDDLVQQVNVLLAEGWVLWGPPSANDGTFFQAIVTWEGPTQVPVNIQPEAAATSFGWYFNSHTGANE